MLYQCMNLQKKLKRMRLLESDVDIIWQGECTQSELEKRFVELTKSPLKEEIKSDPITIYTFKGKDVIKSIYDTLDHLKDIIDISDYKLIETKIYE